MTSGDSVRRRYFYKLSASLVGLLISVVVQSMVPRGLGPKAYGDFSFLTNFFSQVTGFLDMGTSTGFYTKLSQRQKDHGLITFYLLFMVLAITVLFFLVVGSQAVGLHDLFWSEQKMAYVYLAALYGVLSWISQISSRMGDAYNLTIGFEKIRIVQRVLSLVLISILFFAGWLDLETFFFYHYALLIFLVGGQIWFMFLAGQLLWPLARPTIPKLVSYCKEFYHYSHPLFIYSVVGLIVGVLDRWLLQRFSGSVEQGFYSLGYQIGAVCFLFTGAMTPLIQREFAIAFEKKNIQEMARLFRRYIPALYFIAAFLACFVAVQAERVTFYLGGDAYAEALWAITIMALYPLHQTYGQLSGAVFYATGQTRLYRNIGVISMLLGLPITFFLIAPLTQHGLALGSVGLAIKMVLLQFIGVNVQLYYNVKMLKLSFLLFVGHQLVSIIVLLALATGVSAGINALLSPVNTLGTISAFFLAGLMYTLAVFTLVYRIPKLAGLHREDIRQGMRFFQRFGSYRK